MSIAEWDGMMPHSITIEPYQSVDPYGVYIYGSAVTYQARIQGKMRLIMNMQGEQIASSVTVYVAGFGITQQDRLTLPSPFVPNQPPILNVGVVSDESGLHHTVIYA